MISGSLETDAIEILNLSPDGLTCKPFTKYPDARYGTIGGLNNNLEPIICGGSPAFLPSRRCLAYNDDEWIETHSLTYSRLGKCGIKKVIFNTVKMYYFKPPAELIDTAE